MNQLTEYWRGRIQRDLSPFADPNTQIETIDDGPSIHVSWMQRRRQMEAAFKISQLSGAVSVTFLSKQFSYTGFFACEEISDLLGLAKMILQAKPTPIYVETSASAEGDQATTGLATDLIGRAAQGSEDQSATKLVMVTADAGAGKTSALQQLVRQSAEKYVNKQSTHLLLYVDAQGRALSRFSEALATELQDLRVNLTYHGVSTLVRLGLIIPVIDGFDELIGVGGYDDAFSSISLFIEELDGQGSIIASARSTYYEQEFLSRANKISSMGLQAWRLTSITVRAWGDTERNEYVTRRCKGEQLSESACERLASSVRKVFAGANTELGNKPLFVAKTVDVLINGDDLSGTGTLLDNLVATFLAREQRQKLLAQNGKPLLPLDQLVGLYADLAEEMWNQSARELDKASVRELAEMSLIDASVPRGDQQVVIERMPSLAFLKRGDRIGSVAFEHELFFSYFLAKRLAVRLMDKSVALPLLLGRSVLPEGLSDAVAQEILSNVNTVDAMSNIAQQLCGASAARSLKQAQIQENSGSLLASALIIKSADGGIVSDLELSNIVFPGGSLRGVRFYECLFRNVQFRRTELCGTSFLRCSAVECLFTSVLVNERTELEIDGASDVSHFSGLRVLSTDSRVNQLFDPIEIRDELRRCRLPSAQNIVANLRRNVEDDVVQIVEKFARAFQRSNPICVGDDTLRSIFQKPQWTEIQKLLLSSGVVKAETRAAGGPRRTFLRRMVNQQDIAAGLRKDAAVSGEVTTFWEKLEESFGVTTN